MPNVLTVLLFFAARFHGDVGWTWEEIEFMA